MYRSCIEIDRVCKDYTSILRRLFCRLADVHGNDRRRMDEYALNLFHKPAASSVFLTWVNVDAGSHAAFLCTKSTAENSSSLDFRQSDAYTASYWVQA